MSFQSNINQALSIAGLIAAQNPTLKAAAEKRAELKQLETRAQTLTKSAEVSGRGRKPELAQEYREELAEVRKKQFETDPTTLNLRAYKKAQRKAQNMLGLKQNERRKSKQGILEAIINEPTNWGGSVKDLPPAVQNAIAQAIKQNEGAGK